MEQWRLFSRLCIFSEITANKRALMPDATKTPANPPKPAENWVSVRVAAAALGVSEKTVRKRIAAGELTARRVSQNRGGMAYLVALESETETEVESPETEAKWNRNGSEKTPFRVQTASEPETEREANRKRDGSRNGTETEVELLRDSLASERAQVAFLRSTVEQLQRDGAETRAALREALKLAPKALSAGESSTTDKSARIEADAPKKRDGRQSEANGQKMPQIAPDRGETGLTLGDIADELERRLNQ